MDRDVFQQLEDAGIDVRMSKLVPHVPVRVESEENPVPVPVDDEVIVTCGEDSEIVRLRKITELFAGNRVPPDLTMGIPDEYALFAATIERAAFDLSAAARRIPRDEEFADLYRRLWKRPDDSGGDLLGSYVRAGARLYMSLRDVSRAEFEAVVKRLAKSARTFAIGYTSTNYYEHVGRQFLGDDAPSLPTSLRFG
jgi:hypothetical protein